MKEFKGSQGDWSKDAYNEDNHSIDIVLPDETTISIDRQSRYLNEYVLSREGMNANAKLIANAPKMMEYLTKIITEFEKDSLSPDLEDVIFDARDFLNDKILD